MFNSPYIQRSTTRGNRTARLVANTLGIFLFTILMVSGGPALGANAVTPSASPATITTAGQCVTVSFTLTRDGATAARGVNIRFKLDKLELCSPNGLVLGDWAPAATYPGITLTSLLSHGSGEYSVGALIVGDPCGPTGNGVVLKIDVKAAAGITSDTGTVTVLSTDLAVTACTLASLSAAPGAAASVTINIPPGGPLSGFTATQVKTGNVVPTPPTGAFSKYINFQPAAATTPTGYIADTGATYNATRTYGWLSTVTPVVRNLLVNDPSDTFVKKKNSSNPAVWQIDVANGTYRVRVGVGDAFTQGTHIVAVEGTSFFDAVLTQGGGFESAIHNVTVADGQLSVSIGGAHATAPPLTETKINLIEIDAVVLKAEAGSGPDLAAFSETTNIMLVYTPPATGDVKIYRAKFGGYPSYATGSVPTTPTYPPPAATWTDIAATGTPFIDRVADRDFYYYAAFVVTGGVGSAAVMTDGTLNYHLGDVEDAVVGTECIGDNLVNFLDVSKMGAHYGTASGGTGYLVCLDIAPTSNTSSPIDGRPMPNGLINFSDLIYGGFNFFKVSKAIESPAPAAVDRVELTEPGRVRAGERIDVTVRAQGTGRVQGMSVELSWDPAVVRPVDSVRGSMLEAQDGVALSPRPGVVDVTLLGARSVGLSGEGELAKVSFEALRAGDPAVRLARVEALDTALQPIEVAWGSDPDVVTAPRAVELLQNVPNPFNPSTKIVFSIPEAGVVELAVYGVDGRRVRSLVQATREAGRHEVVWDGTDARGVRVASGTYFVHLTAPDVARTLAISLVK